MGNRRKLIKGKNNKSRKSRSKPRSKFEMPTGKDFRRSVLIDYALSIENKKNKPFHLKYFNSTSHLQYEAHEVEERYNYEKILFLVDPKNQALLFKLNKNLLERRFGPSALYSYGINSKYSIKDLPTGPSTREDEHYVFLHDDNCWQAFVDAQKIPIEGWQLQENTRYSNIETRKCLLNVNGEILIGEFTKERVKEYNRIQPDAKSGMKFSIYYRGLQEGKFIVDRWDYTPLTSHYCKFDGEGNFTMDGYLRPHTLFSHRHPYLLKHRLFMTQNQSPDVIPTPINQDRTEGEEARYDSFDSFVMAFEKTFNVSACEISKHEVVSTRFKKLGNKYCTPQQVKPINKNKLVDFQKTSTSEENEITHSLTMDLASISSLVEIDLEDDCYAGTNQESLDKQNYSDLLGLKAELDGKKAKSLPIDDLNPIENTIEEFKQ